MFLLYEFENGNVMYEIDIEELQNAIIQIILTRNNVTTINSNEHKLLLMLVNELDIIWNDKILKELEDEIKEYFYEDAYIRYQQECADTADAETWYGTKKDIIGV